MGTGPVFDTVRRSRSARTSTQRLRRIASVLLTAIVAAGLLSVAPRSSAATFSPLTEPQLQTAVNTANGNGEDDTIDLGGNTFGLTATLVVGADSGHSLTIQNGSLDGQDSRRVLEVNSGANLTLESVTVTGGRGGPGGGIFNHGGIVNITSSTLSVNSATSGGGGIFNHGGIVNITSSTLSGNSATLEGSGGGIFNHGGIVNITSSTLSGNSATFGGAIYNNGGTANITSSTLSGGSATLEGSGGGIFNGGGTVNITSSTLSANLGGGIFTNVHGTTSVGSSIVAAQSSGPDCDGAAGTTASTGYNLESGTSCGFTGTGDLQNADPKLGPLTDNSGPTKIHALLAGSQALDHIPTSDASCTGTDQRGIDRPQGTHCDIGSFESRSFTLTAATAGAGADVASAEGTLASEPAGISCSRTTGADDQGDCAETYLEQSEITVTATPAPTSTATISDGCAAGPGAAGAAVSCVVTMSDAAAVTATFTKLAEVQSLSNVRKLEGDSEGRTFGFKLTLSTPAAGGEQVSFRAVPGSAKHSDFKATNGTITFAPGQTTANIKVMVYGDRQVEDNERFRVKLSDPQDLTLADARGIGIIRNDDQSSVARCPGTCIG